MSNLSIKNVPEAWAEALRQRAARNHRSLQGELMAILEQALVEPVPERLRGVRQGWKTVEQVAAELRERYPDGLPSGPSSIDLIREDRDSR